MKNDTHNRHICMQRRSSGFLNGRWMWCVFCLSILVCLVGPLWAQTSLRKMMQKRSTPDRLATDVIQKASNFSAQEMRMIDGRSVMSAPLANQLGRRSEFSPADVRQIAVRSEFSASQMRVVQKRSEVDAAVAKQVQRHSTPDARLRQRDRLIDELFFNMVQKQSEMNPQEKRQVAKASQDAAIQAQLQRNSVAAASYSRLLSKRSAPESSIQRLLRSRSVD